MPKICYTQKKFGADSMRLINTANSIIASYASQGFDLTLRQLYYQMVSRAIIPNNERTYKNLGTVIGDARLAGLIDWESIVDRTRNVRENTHWDSPADIVAACAQQYRVDLWANQPTVPEVWIEKDALVGVIDNICSSLDVPFFSCRGYNSLSEMWAGAMRIARRIRCGKNVVVFHLGDHDPSGIDMTRDIEDRLSLFVGRPVKVERLALNMKQIRQYNPPPNPAKLSDARAQGYVSLHGNQSWELDALDPTVITGLIQKAVFGIRDVKIWQQDIDKQDECRQLLTSVSMGWDSIVEQL